MTREIREGINHILCHAIPEVVRGIFVEDIISFLHSRGVVIQVDRELPLVTEVDVNEWSEATLNGILTAQRFMVEAGYVATKSLIGGSSPPTFRDGSTLECSTCKTEPCECPSIDRGSFAKYVEEEE